MQYLYLAISLASALCAPVRSSYAQSADATLNEFNKMIATLRTEQASNQRMLQMLRDGTMIMAPIALETREGKMITLHDFLDGPNVAEQVMNEDPQGKHPTWIKSLRDRQYIPISKDQFTHYITMMVIKRHLEVDGKDTRFNPRTFVANIRQDVANAVEQTEKHRAFAITVYEKHQAGVNASLLDLLKRRDALQEAIRNGTYKETEPEVAGAASWARTWNTGWGDVVLQVSGNSVTGTFTHKDGKLEGQLSADGRKLTGRWTQAPTRKAPNDAGAFEFTLGEDGKRFTGRWWYGFDTSKAADGSWSGTAK
jgi:hypothetical protein